MIIRKIITASYLLLILSAISNVQALTIDTTIVGENSPGPYPLGWHFVDTSSIVVTFVDSTAGTIPPYTYIDEVNGLLFSEPIDSGVILSVHYTTEFLGLQKTHYLYKRIFIDLSDTAQQKKIYGTEYKKPFTDENLNISGYKSISISFGSQGQMNLEQALEVRIFGNIRENTVLSANLSDQGTSLEGDTREIGEIDRMYIALENPRYNIVAGDQFVSMPYGGLLEGYKKIKGLSAAYTGEQVQAGAFGAISGGKYTVQNIRGQLGFQGPYYLTGNGEADIITPIYGTVKVIVDGKELKEGENKDYVIDYDIGSIRFMPTFPIDDNNLIQVYYEYKAFDYQRTFLGTDVGITTHDSSLSTKGVIWYETDNKNHPLDLELDKVTIDSLKQSGDNVPLVPNGREIHPNDVASKDAIYRLYKIEYSDFVPNGFYYVYTPYNSENPADNKGFYHVWFTQVPEGTGNYICYTIQDTTLTETMDSAQITILNATLNQADTRGPAYIYVGEGNGNFTALSPASAPRRTIKGEIRTSVTPREWLSLSVDVAGEEEDKNLFSDKDDRDNTAAASKSSFIIGRNVYDERCLWFGGNHSFSSRRFSREILSSYERRNLWDREYNSVLGNEVHVWQLSTGTTFWPDVSTGTSYGQYFQNDSLLTHRIGYNSRLAVWEHLCLNYSGRFIKHFDSSETENLRGDSISAILDYNLFNYGLYFDDEWRNHISNVDRGKIGGGLDILFKPVSLNEFVYYSQDRKGGQSIFLPLDPASNDTGSNFIWRQSVSYSPLSTWTLSGSSSYHLRKKLLVNKSEEKRSVLLVTVSNDVASVKTGVSTHQDYRLSSERASSYVQIPIYVGEGQGTHSFDTSLNEYVVDRLGDYIIEDREMFNVAGRESIRKSTFQGNWFFKPQSKKIKGILADISWHGSFMMDEHIRLDSALIARGKIPKNTWIPGYSSLAGKNDSLITFADIFYRQDADWHPAMVEGLHGNIYVRPFLRKLRNFDENGVEWGYRIDKRWTKWFIGCEGQMHTVNRYFKYGFDSTVIKDRSITLKERYYFVPSFSIFTNETIGKAEKDTTVGPYYRLQPGLTLQLMDKGWAELSYTWSQVNIDGQIEYPMAQGFGAGTSHVIDFIIDINAGEHFSVGGSYRGDYNRNINDKMLHVVSMEVKAFL